MKPGNNTAAKLIIDSEKVNLILSLCEIFEGDRTWPSLYKSIKSFIKNDLEFSDKNLFLHYTKKDIEPQAYTLERAFQQKAPYYVSKRNNKYLEQLLDLYIEKYRHEFEKNKREKKAKVVSPIGKRDQYGIGTSVHVAIKKIIGDDEFLNKLYTSLSISILIGNDSADHNALTVDQANIFLRFCKSLQTVYTTETIFISLNIIADRNGIMGKISMKEFFIQLSYVTQTEIKTRDSLVRNETELNALKIRRSIENNQQLTKDYIINFSLQNIQNLLVLGNPGVGKSTFCRWLCYEWSQYPKTTNNVVPVYIQLKGLEFGDQGNVIINYIYRNYLLGDGSENRDMHDVLRKVHPFVCYILDGFDELSKDHKEHLFNHLHEISSNCKYILASRPYGILNTVDIKCDQLIQLDGFDTANINNYIDVFMQKNTIAKGKEKETLLEIINLNPTLTDFAHNPLMLSFIVYIYLSDDNADEILRRIQTRFDLQQVVIGWMFVHNKSKVSTQFDNRLIESISEFANEMEFKKTAEMTGYTHGGEFENVLLPISQLGIGQLTEATLGKYKFYFNSITFQEYFASISVADKITSPALEYLLQDSYFWNLAAMIIGQISNEATASMMGSLLSACEEELMKEERDYIYYKYVLLLSECRSDFLNKKLNYSVLKTINRAFGQNVRKKDSNKAHLKYAFAECTQRIYNKMSIPHRKSFKKILLNEMENSWRRPNDPILKWDSSCKHLPLLVKYLDLHLDIDFTTSCINLLTTALEEYRRDNLDFSVLWDMPDFVVAILQNNPKSFFLMMKPYLEKVLSLLPPSFLNFRGRIELHNTDAKVALIRLNDQIHAFNEAIDDIVKENQVVEIAVLVFILGKKKRELERKKDISESQHYLLEAANIIYTFLSSRDQNYDIGFVDLPRPITQLAAEGLFESNNYPSAIDILTCIDDEYLFFDQIIQTNLHNYFDGIVKDTAFDKDETNLRRICTMIYCIPALKNKIAFHRNELTRLVNSYIENNGEKFQGSKTSSSVDYFFRLLERSEQDIYENDRKFFVEFMLSTDVVKFPYFNKALFPRVIRNHRIIYNAVYWDYILSFLDKNDDSLIKLGISMYLNKSIYQYVTNLPYIQKLFEFLYQIPKRDFYPDLLKSQAENILTVISNTLMMLKQSNIASHQVLPFIEEILKQDTMKNEIKENSGKNRTTGACNSAYILQYYFSNDSDFDLKIDYWDKFQKNNQNKALVEYIYPAFVHNGSLPEDEINRIKDVTGSKFIQELQNQLERMKVYQFPFVKEEFVSLCTH